MIQPGRDDPSRAGLFIMNTPHRPRITQQRHHPSAGGSGAGGAGATAGAGSGAGWAGSSAGVGLGGIRSRGGAAGPFPLVIMKPSLSVNDGPAGMFTITLRVPGVASAE